MSYILIDSKNYSNCPNWDIIGEGLRPRGVSRGQKPTKQTNLIGCKSLNNVYLAIVQNFGDPSSRQKRVDVYNRKLNEETPSIHDSLHFSLVLNGLSDTYSCLSTPDPDCANVGKALEDISYLSVPYIDPKNPSAVRTKQPCFAVESLSFAFGGKEKEIAGEDILANWDRERKRLSALKNQSIDQDVMNVDLVDDELMMMDELG
jgi:hypothetical protein